jgi:endonuclease III
MPGPLGGRRRDSEDHARASAAAAKGQAGRKKIASAFRKFREDGWDTPEHFTADDQHPLWHELWEGNYHRMSSVMSEELRDVMRALIADYDGSVARLVRTASTREDISQRLQRIRGVGPKTAEIFLREVPDALIGTG